MRALLLLLASLLAACGGGSDPVDAGVDSPVVEVDGGLYVPAGWTATPYLSDVPIRSFAAVGPGTEPDVDYGAVIETDVGVMVVDLAEVRTPMTVQSFVWLARNRFFEGIAFHRVISGFMAQTGDPNTVDMPPSTWGFGGCGYQFGLEIDPALRFDGPGVLGMARTADPGSNGSQFFITLAPAAHLNDMYTVFGRVIEGQTVLTSIAIGEPPALPTRIVSVSIIQR
jgi:peptidylprolyl isomerase